MGVMSAIRQTHLHVPEARGLSEGGVPVREGAIGLIVLWLVAIIIMCGQGTMAFASGDDEREALATLQQYFAAIEKKDADAILQVVDPSFIPVAFFGTEPEQLAERLAAQQADVRITPVAQQVYLSGDKYAFVVGSYQAVLIPSGNPASQRSEVAEQVYFLRKEQGRWKIFRVYTGRREVISSLPRSPESRLPAGVATELQPGEQVPALRLTRLDGIEIEWAWTRATLVYVRGRDTELKESFETDGFASASSQTVKPG